MAGMSRKVIAGIVIVALVLLLPIFASLLRAEETIPFADSALHVAAKKGEMGPVEELLKSGAAVNVRDEFGKTALHYAAENGHEGTTGVLLKYGADPDVVDANGYTALRYAEELWPRPPRARPRGGQQSAPRMLPHRPTYCPLPHT